jgi:hypothetical protein
MASRGESIVDVWEREPAQDVADVRLDVEEGLVFAALRHACAAHLAGDRRVMLQAYGPGDPGEDADRCAWLRAFVPGPHDAGFDAWAVRHTPPFLLHVSHLHQFHPALRNAVDAVAHSVFPRVGLPDGRMWVDCYAGDYGLTPFGVHIDGNSNLTFAIRGTKRLLLWEPEVYWREWARRGRFDLRDDDARAELTALATVLEAAPGRTIYWPSRFWHVAEPKAGLSVTMNVAAYWREEDALRTSYARRLDDPIALLHGFREALTDDEIRHVVAALQPIVRTLLPRVAPGVDRRARPSLREGVEGGPIDADDPEAARHRVAYISSYGLGPVPPGPLPTGQPEHVVARGPVVWTTIDASVFVGLRGHVLECTASPTIDAMLDALARGRSIAWNELEAALSGGRLDGELTTARELVTRLVRIGALGQYQPPPP